MTSTMWRLTSQKNNGCAFMDLRVTAIVHIAAYYENNHYSDIRGVFLYTKLIKLTWQINSGTVHSKNYAHAFTLFCFVVVMYWLGLTHILQGCFTGTGQLYCPVPVKQPWTIWVNRSQENSYMISLIHNKAPKSCVHIHGVYCIKH